MRREAEDIVSVELRDPGDALLQPFTAGSHIDVHLPNGLVRQYSLLNDPAEQHRYVIGVGLNAASRGGSRYVHERLRVGELLDVAGPRNHFRLAEDAPEHVLIGGGIGITPLLSMLRRLTALQRRFRLYYGVREGKRSAFTTDITALQPDFSPHIDAKHGKPLDLAGIVADHPEAHFYCCGPAPMLAAFETAAASVAQERIHIEHFQPKPIDAQATQAGFEVECRISKKTVQVAAGNSIAQALEAAGIAVDLSCQEGICGTCETRVLEGVPEHRDSVLSSTEREANRSMMICVSRCRGERLVLDI